MSRTDELCDRGRDGKPIDWMRYSAILGNINFIYRMALISEVEYNRAIKELRDDYHVVSHVYY